MTAFETIRVAAIQATPVILDAEATVDKTVGLLNAAADDNVQLAVLPETFVSLYPSGAWAHAAAKFSGFDELWERMWASSVDVPGPLVDRIAEVCSEPGCGASSGSTSARASGPGRSTTRCSRSGPEGLVAKHRKLMPTQHERLFHGSAPATTCMSPTRRSAASAA